MNKAEWVRTYLGNPNEWGVDRDGVIYDDMRDWSERIVGYVSCKDGIATIRWRVSGTVSEVPAWSDQ